MKTFTNKANDNDYYQLLDKSRVIRIIRGL